MRAALAAAPMGLALASFGASAFGQGAPSHGVASDALGGSWVFETAAFGQGEGAQYLTGELELISDGEDRWSCMLWVDDVFENQAPTIHATQSCSAVRTGNVLRIESVILTTEPPTDTYIPDNFVLEIESASRMEGALIVMDGLRPAAVFVRGEAPIS